MGGNGKVALRRWAAATAVAAWALIVLGGAVSATESGMGCGDHWPLCHGRVVPDLSRTDVLLEYGHRVWAGVVASLTAATAWQARREPAVRGTALAALALVVVQSLLGAWTVVLGLSVPVSTVHLATAQLYFLTLVVAWTRAAAPGGPLREPGAAGGEGVGRLARLAWVTLALGYATAVLGGYVKLSGAGLGCGLSFPLCWGRAWPDLAAPGGHLALAHWLHRLAAFALAGHVLALALRARRGAADPATVRLAGVAAALVALQVALGVATVWTRLEPALSVAHLANGTALLGVLAALAVRLGAAVGTAPARARLVPAEGTAP